MLSSNTPEGRNTNIPRPIFLFKLLAIPLGTAFLVYTLTQMGGINVSDFPIVQTGFALIVFLISSVLAGFRMGVTLYCVGAKIAPLRAIRTHMHALFYHIFMPFGVGSDIAKFAMFHKVVEIDKTQLAGGLILDRIIGVSSFALIVGVTAPILFRHPLFILVLPSLVILMGLITLNIKRILVVFPEKLATPLMPLQSAISTHRYQLMISLGISVLSQLVMGIAVWIVGRGWIIDISFVQAVFGNSAAFLFQIVPLHLAGLSGTEIAGVGVYTALGFSVAEALLLVSMVYAFRISAAMVGGLLDGASMIAAHATRSPSHKA